METRRPPGRAQGRRHHLRRLHSAPTGKRSRSGAVRRGGFALLRAVCRRSSAAAGGVCSGALQQSRLRGGVVQLAVSCHGRQEASHSWARFSAFVPHYRFALPGCCVLGLVRFDVDLDR